MNVQLAQHKSAGERRGQSAGVASPWWLAPEQCISNVANRATPPTVRMRLRLGEGVLDGSFGAGTIVDFLRASFGECEEAAGANDAPANLVCTVFESAASPCAVVELEAGTRFDEAGLAMDLLRHEYLGADEKFVEVATQSRGWRMIASSFEPARPVIAIAAGRVVVDLERQPWNFVPRFLVSAVMSLQPATIFVHAAAVAIAKKGVLLAGPSGAGKTTLSLGLAARGHDFYGENVVGLRSTTGDLLPFRRVALLRPGACSRAISGLMAREGVELAHIAATPGALPKLPFHTTRHFPPAGGAAVPLECAFFLRSFASRPAAVPFTPAMDAFDHVLRPLSFDILVAASWGPQSGWLMKYLRICAMLAQARCYHLDCGDPDATADLVERTAMETT